MRLHTCERCSRPFQRTTRRRFCTRCEPAAAGATPAAAQPAQARPPRRGSTRAGRKLRAIVLERDHDTCHYCGEPARTVDHIVPVAHGGPEDESNLVAACGRCNTAKGDRPLTPRPTIAILGDIATGKSTVARALAERSGWPVLSIADYRARHQDWPHLLADLEAAGPAIVESVAVPRDYRRLLILRRALLLVVTCPEPVRQQRLAQRDRPVPARARFRDAGHARVDGTADVPASVLEALVARAARRGDPASVARLPH